MSHVKVLAFQVFHDQSTQEREAKKKEKLQREICNFNQNIKINNKKADVCCPCRIFIT